MKTRLIEDTILLDKYKGPRSTSYASNRTPPSTLRRIFFALLTLLFLLLAGTTALDTCLSFPRLPAVIVMTMEVPVLGLLEWFSALGMRAGGTLAAS